MIRFTRAFGYFFVSLTIIVYNALYPPQCRAQAEADLIVQPASREIILTGYTRSQTTMTLSSEVAGRVLQINYEDGQVIGELPFLRIDSTFVDLEISSVQHSLDQLKITRNKRRSRVDYLEKEYRRIENLFQRGSSPESRRDTALEDLDQARLDLNAIGVEIAIARTRLKELQERKSRHTIYAPAGWVVVAKQVEKGELVTLNTPVARVADFENLVVPLSVSAQELDALQQLTPEFDATLEGRPARVAINWINPEFDEKTRKLSIELIIRNHKSPRRGGLIFQLPLKIAAEGLWVPKKAVTSRYENPRVFLKETGVEIKVLVLGQTEHHLIIANDPRLPPGTQLGDPASF
jgi:multidrug efflux pump subunit AcrA (membrane-fusion protein)